MSQPSWDPERYLVYAGERGRPFVDLIGRIDAAAPLRVVDLGCGPGNLTQLLTQRWPGAEVVGIDSSVEMIDKAKASGISGVRFEVGDVQEWQADAPVDVFISNATLQWVPGHLDLLPELVGQVAPGGWFAFQVPGNFGAPSHALLHELSADDRFSPYLEGVAPRPTHEPEDYLDVLLGIGCEVDAWETTYFHLLQGEDPVFTWISGTGARPTLQSLPDDLRAEFETEYKQLLREAYPTRERGTVLPFRRIFMVARVPA